MKNVLVVGANEKLDRYSNMAVRSLLSKGFPVLAFGNRIGQIEEVAILTDWNLISDVDTVTLYINPIIQEKYYDRIIALKPRRVIFNPGTENPSFENILLENDIEAIEACTLVMLSTGIF